MQDDQAQPPAQSTGVSQGTSHASPAGVVLCVIWTPPGLTPEPRLRSALRRPQMRVVHCDDEFAVVSHLCGTRGGGVRRASLLLLVEPRMLPQAADVLAALAERVASLNVWIFDPSSSEVLRSLSIEQAQALARAGFPTTGDDHQPRATTSPTTNHHEPHGVDDGGVMLGGASLPAATLTTQADLVVEPKPAGAAPPTSDAVAAYGGVVGPWMSAPMTTPTSGAEPAGAGFTPAPKAPTGGAPVAASPAPARGGPPVLRLTDAPSPPSPSSTSSPHGAPDAAPASGPAPHAAAANGAALVGEAPLLTDEELAMLLGEGVGEGVGEDKTSEQIAAKARRDR